MGPIIMSTDNGVNALFLKARSYFTAAEYSAVIALCDQVLEQQPDRAEFLNLKGLALMTMAKPGLALESLSRACSLDPLQAGIQLNAARAAMLVCRSPDARQYLQAAARSGMHDSAVMYQCAVTSRDLGDYSQAQQWSRRALELAPGSAEIWHLEGLLNVDAGANSKAQTAFERAATIQPDHAGALAELSRLRPDAAVNASLNNMLERVLANGPDKDQATAAFALAGLNRSQGQHGKAAELYRQANALVNKTGSFDLEAWVEIQEQTLENLDHPGWEPAEPVTSSRMVFILGMPRSGTSLCEAIAGSHPGIFACGELTALHYLAEGFRRDGEDIFTLDTGTAQARKAREQYLQTLPKAALDATLATDKSPMNFTRIALIDRLFPGARIVHCQRHPLDTIASIWFQNFQSGLDWAFSLENITTVYITQHKLMAAWQEALNGGIHAFAYEDTVNDPSGQAQTLCEFLGLEYDPDMAQPHRHTGVVSTASNIQVRQPIYHSSVGNWQPYRQELDVAAQMLRDAGLLSRDMEQPANRFSTP